MFYYFGFFRIFTPEEIFITNEKISFWEAVHVDNFLYKNICKMYPYIHIQHWNNNIELNKLFYVNNSIWGEECILEHIIYLGILFLYMIYAPISIIAPLNISYVLIQGSWFQCISISKRSRRTNSFYLQCCLHYYPRIEKRRDNIPHCDEKELCVQVEEVCQYRKSA